MLTLKASNFRNEFMKSSFLPKYERNFFCPYFWRNDDFINSFWNLLTFSGSSMTLGSEIIVWFFFIDLQRAYLRSFFSHAFKQTQPLKEWNSQRSLFLFDYPPHLKVLQKLIHFRDCLNLFSVGVYTVDFSLQKWYM